MRVQVINRLLKKGHAPSCITQIGAVEKRFLLTGLNSISNSHDREPFFNRLFGARRPLPSISVASASGRKWPPDAAPIGNALLLLRRAQRQGLREPGAHQLLDCIFATVVEMVAVGNDFHAAGAA